MIIANSRFEGGLSGGDAIYESFKKYCPCEVVVHEMRGVDYLPFFTCYIQRIIMGCVTALLDSKKYEFVYSASDFLPDSIPAAIYKIKGTKWVAGFYLKAFRDNPLHYYSQKMVKVLINWLADMVIVTNPTMYDVFPKKVKTWINGGIDLSLAGLSDEPKIYDAVFCGRIHPSKGIDELAQIWKLVREQKPNATLAVIGDGDLGVDYLKGLIGKNMGVTYFGYMGDERFKVYKQSRVVLYPTPLKYDHFSMAPIEAMACGCPCFSFKTPVISSMAGKGWVDLPTKESIAYYIVNSGNKEHFERHKLLSRWAEETANEFDYQKQSLRVYKEVHENLNYRREWNRWDSD